MLRILEELLSIGRCGGCGAPGSAWCAACASVRPDVQWHRIDVQLFVCTAFEYRGPVGRTLVSWKERQQRDARIRVERWFAAGIGPMLDRRPDLVCVPIPSSPSNDRIRGTRMLHDVLEAIGVPMSDALHATRSRRDQAGLSRVERYENLRDALQWTGDTDRPLLLVDDVVTSGATVRAAGAAVAAAHGRVWAAFGLTRRGQLAPVAPPVRGVRLQRPSKEVHRER